MMDRKPQNTATPIAEYLTLISDDKVCMEDIPMLGAEYRAIFAFKAEHTDGLSFESGDLIIVTSDTSENGWWYGFHGKDEGWFPSSYVEESDDYTPLHFSEDSIYVNKDHYSILQQQSNPCNTQLQASRDTKRKKSFLVSAFKKLWWKISSRDIAAILEAFFPPYKLNFHTYPGASALQWGDGIDWEAFYTGFAQPLQEAIPELKWKGAAGNQSVLFTPVWTDMGLCYQFNTEKQHFMVSRAGAKVGLSLLLFANQDDYLITNSEAAGFRILLHSAGEVPRMRDWGKKVSVGSSTGIAVTVKSVNSLPAPFGKCNNASDYIKSRCELKCESDFIMDQCKCREIYMPGDLRICDLFDIYNCTTGAKARFVSEGHHEKCQCLPQCRQLHYITSLSSAVSSNLLNTFISKYLNTTMQFVKDNFLLVDIYTSDLSYEEITTKRAYPILALLCDIGGAMGLLLGSTLLTLFEITDFLCVLVKACCGKTYVNKF